MQEPLQDGEDFEAAEPVPATFVAMAALLTTWPKVPSLALWADSPTPPARKWDGRRRVVTDTTRTRPVPAWAELAARHDEMA